MGCRSGRYPSKDNSGTGQASRLLGAILRRGQDKEGYAVLSKVYHSILGGICSKKNTSHSDRSLGPYKALLGRCTLNSLPNYMCVMLFRTGWRCWVPSTSHVSIRRTLDPSAEQMHGLLRGLRRGWARRVGM